MMVSRAGLVQRNCHCRGSPPPCWLLGVMPTFRQELRHRRRSAEWPTARQVLITHICKAAAIYRTAREVQFLQHLLRRSSRPGVARFRQLGTEQVLEVPDPSGASASVPALWCCEPPTSGNAAPILFCGARWPYHHVRDPPCGYDRGRAHPDRRNGTGRSSR